MSEEIKEQTKHLKFTSRPSGQDMKIVGHSRRYYRNHKSLKLNEKKWKTKDTENYNLSALHACKRFIDF